MDKSSIVSLRVGIVGAGIGGLTAAIALRREGHHVDVRPSFFLTGRTVETGIAVG